MSQEAQAWVIIGVTVVVMLTFRRKELFEVLVVGSFIILFCMLLTAVLREVLK